jgi:hypothetical protein
MSQTSRTRGTVVDEDSEEEVSRRKRIRWGKQVARGDEKEDPSVRLKKAYEQVAQAEVELAMAKIAMNSYIDWKKNQREL